MPWGILEEKYIKYIFEIESCISGITGQEITIQSQNMMNCMEF